MWNAFTDEGSIKKAVLRSHLDCQGGLPQNTLAKSALKILDCQGGQPEEYLGQEQGYVEYVPEILSEFFLLLGFSQYSLCTNISKFSLFVQIPSPLSVTLPNLSNVMSSS